jgi:AmmeMemoRadiSam system protein B
MRQPAVAGQFYRGTADALREQIDDCYTHELGPGRLPSLDDDGGVAGLVSPHAGYTFSGPVAAHGFLELGPAGLNGKTAVIIGPNHTGIGSPVSVLAEDFKTPLGVAHIDRDMARQIIDAGFDEDPSAHTYEHSVEVQIPFLQHLTDDFRILPIVMMAQNLGIARDLGKALSQLPSDKVVFIASTDFSHYVPKEICTAADAMAIDRIIAMDADGLFRTVTEKRISMCGFGPVMAVLEAVGSGEATLLKQADSGDVMSMTEVVGYASVKMVRSG